MYQELYLHLFNAITDALSRLSAQDTEEAAAILRTAQQEAERRYMESGED